MIVKAWGDWTMFQTLLVLLRTIGDRHGGKSIANIATRWVLDHDFVGAVIIGEPLYRDKALSPSHAISFAGARLGLSDHASDNSKVFGWTLSEEDRADIEEILNLSNGRKIICNIGDCGAEYR